MDYIGKAKCYPLRAEIFEQPPGSIHAPGIHVCFHVDESGLWKLPSNSVWILQGPLKSEEQLDGLRVFIAEGIFQDPQCKGLFAKVFLYSFWQEICEVIFARIGRRTVARRRSRKPKPAKTA